MALTTTQFLDEKTVTPEVATHITTEYYNAIMDKNNVQEIEDDWYSQVKSRSRSRFGVSSGSNELLSLEFHPSGNYLAYSRMDGSLTVWYIPTMANFFDSTTRKVCLKDAVGTDKLVTSISFNVNEVSQLITSSNSNEIIIWSVVGVSTKFELQKIKSITVGNNRTKVNNCLFSPRGKWIIAATKSESLYLYDVTDFYKLKFTLDLTTILKKDDSIYSMSWNNSNDYLSLGTKSGKLIVLQIVESNDEKIVNIEHIYTIDAHRNSVTTLKFDPYGRFLISGSSDGTCTIWDLSTFIAKLSIDDVDSSIISLDVDMLGKTLVICSRDDKISFYNINDGELINSIVVKNSTSDLWFKFYPNKAWFVMSTKDNILNACTSSYNDQLKFWKVKFENQLTQLRMNKQAPRNGTNTDRGKITKNNNTTGINGGRSNSGHSMNRSLNKSGRPSRHIRDRNKVMTRSSNTTTYSRFNR